MCFDGAKNRAVSAPSCLLKRVGSTPRGCERLPSHFPAPRLGAHLCPSTAPSADAARTCEEAKSQRRTVRSPTVTGQEAMDRDGTPDSFLRLVTEPWQHKALTQTHSLCLGDVLPRAAGFTAAPPQTFANIHACCRGQGASGNR